MAGVQTSYSAEMEPALAGVCQGNPTDIISRAVSGTNVAFGNVVKASGEDKCVLGAGETVGAKASCLCGALGTNLAGMKAVTDGEFAITIGGTVVDIIGCDFSVNTALDEIVDTINALALGKFVAIYDSKTTMVLFESDDTVSALTAVSGGSGTDISGAGFLNGLTAVATLVGATSSLLDALGVVKRSQENTLDSSDKVTETESVNIVRKGYMWVPIVNTGGPNVPVKVVKATGLLDVGAVTPADVAIPAVLITTVASGGDLGLVRFDF